MKALTNTMTGHENPVRSLLDTISAALTRTVLAMAESSRAGKGAREYQRLSALSDAELARIGLRRDDIMRHAFGPTVWI